MCLGLFQIPAKPGHRRHGIVKWRRGNKTGAGTPSPTPKLRNRSVSAFDFLETGSKKSKI
jgi:hypothetical protein